MGVKELGTIDITCVGKVPETNPSGSKAVGNYQTPFFL